MKRVIKMYLCHFQVISLLTLSSMKKIGLDTFSNEGSWTLAKRGPGQGSCFVIDMGAHVTTTLLHVGTG